MTAAFEERFQAFVCEGDTIATEADGYRITARIMRDDCPDAPDQRQDGFWPSLDPDDAGFIGPGLSRADLDAATERARTVMDAWRTDAWFYCGIVLSVAFAEVPLDDHAASLWGIEANHPGADNVFLTEIAGELLDEALDAARAAYARLCRVLCGEESSRQAGP